MSIRYIKQEGRVFRLEMTPDTPGYRRRTFTLKVESGPPLTLEEYRYISATLVADLVARGIDVHGWGDGNEDGD